MPTEKAIDRAAWQAARKFRADYARRLDEAASVAGSYQATYGKSRRTICSWIEAARYNWIAAGMPARGPVFPPLDRPAEMFKWWVENMKNTPPSVLVDLASGRSVTPPRGDSSASSREGQGESAPAAESGSLAPESHSITPKPAPRAALAAKSTPPPTGARADSAAPQSMDLEQAYTAQQRYVAAACRRYDDAVEKNATSVELKVLAEERNKSIETLRKLRADLDAAAREQGRLVSLPELRGELAPIFESIASSFLRTLRNDVGLSPDRARQLADACFSDLRASRFAPPSTAAPPLAA